MLGVDQLKERIIVTRNKVECPVRGCYKKVARQGGRFRRGKRFKCPEHNIYISPSTFEYEYAIDNLLWHNTEDLSLLNGIRHEQPHMRMAGDNSEEAITWNVLRYLDKKNLLVPVLYSLTGIVLKRPEVIYWSYCGREGSYWSELKEAQEEFGERPGKSSEPDIIINTANAILFIDAKMIMDNNTKPANGRLRKKYLKGGSHWYQQVFRSDYQQVAIEDKKYELMREWLLGTWMATRRGTDFYLINIAREGKEEDIEAAFGEHIYSDQGRRFVRITWEGIYKQILEYEEAGSEKEKMLQYFREKTVGYGRKGILHKAFQV